MSGGTLQGTATRYIALLLQTDCVPYKPLQLKVHQPFNGKRHDMAQRDMRFLNVHRHLAGDSEQHISMFRQLAAALARHGTDPDAVFTRRLAGRDRGRHHLLRDQDAVEALLEPLLPLRLQLERLLLLLADVLLLLLAP
mgnify:CR=1 FL=1